MDWFGWVLLFIVIFGYPVFRIINKFRVNAHLTRLQEEYDCEMGRREREERMTAQMKYNVRTRR